MPHTVLLAEDDRAIRHAVERALTLEGYEVTAVADGIQALASAHLRPPDILVLDVMMPGIDGLQVCQVLRAEGDRTPILMLTARVETADRIAGLDAGADDYVAKPFEIEEVFARLRALLRRADGTGRRPDAKGAAGERPGGTASFEGGDGLGGAEVAGGVGGPHGSRGAGGVSGSGGAGGAEGSDGPHDWGGAGSPDGLDGLVTAGDLRIDPLDRRVWRGSVEVDLTRTEFDLLELLARNAGIVLDHPTIYDRIWGYDFGPSSKNLAVYVGYLRRKLDVAGAAPLIHTVRGVGYVLREP
ncbi:response regulator transcription factor [Streptomyces sp. NPDC041068]|uniref:response regulator transcription factor n=1 Tax=Streptomyces sp. NPDC041068 TaxID=3155130 RepID=UPI0033CA9543